VYYIMPFISESFRFWHWKISNLQQEMEKRINCSQRLSDYAYDIKYSREQRFTNDDQISIIYDERAAVERMEKYKQKLRLLQPAYAAIQRLYEKIEFNKKKLHEVTMAFDSAFDVVLLPDFKADQSLLKKKQSSLSKKSKTTACDLSHAAYKKKLKRTMSRKGKCLITPSEACSTMFSDCGHFTPQGFSRVHSCPNCRKKTVRDECGVATAAFCMTRILIASKTQNKNSKDRVCKNPLPLENVTAWPISWKFCFENRPPDKSGVL
jgi:hypothetical protein